MINKEPTEEEKKTALETQKCCREMLEKYTLQVIWAFIDEEHCKKYGMPLSEATNTFHLVFWP